MENTAFVSDSEVDDAINLAGRSLFAELVKAYGEGHFESSATFATVSGQYDYSSALPSSFYRLVGMSAAVAGNNELRLQRGTPEDMLRSATGGGWGYGPSVFYELRGQTVRLAPTPTAVHTVTIRYVSANLFFDTSDVAIAEMTADTDEMKVEDLLWEDFVVTHAAIRCMRKEQADTSELRQDLAVVAAQIASLAGQRDQGEAMRVRMVM